MSWIVVLEDPRRFPLNLPQVQVVAAQDYLMDAQYGALRGAKVFNLCRTYGYQTTGYYVSLLAAARGHKPLPSIATLQDLRQAPLVRVVSQELDELIQQNLHALRSDRFTLSIYFGRNLAKRYDRLSRALFNQFPAPLLRAEFRHQGRWRLERLRPIATGDIPASHHGFVVDQAQQYFKRPPSKKGGRAYRYDLAILVNPDEENAPSNEGALKRFAKAARAKGLRTTFIGKEDYGRIGEFDALFIRETTQVNHHTYRFSRRAAAEGLVVIDDPESILRCTNKVYLAELFNRHRIPNPKTLIVDDPEDDRVARELGFPCVIKQPDSSFSRGVTKAKDEREMRQQLKAVLDESELAVVQAFVPSDFDWRIGVLAGQPLYACKYFMARGSWTIQTTDSQGRNRYGLTQTMPLEEAPPRVVKLATQCARLIGDGFYGVDIKEVKDRFLVMEVNDNPSVEWGVEDEVLGQGLYEAVMQTFLDRLEARGK